ncbi:PAQR family membrane homeostasis protein TrhA [Nonlabens marinus]|uniref:Predicted membrane protein hemolysin III homolog n=1 Tax=Nonlabens marinus S1-08 TaxID=1454201 RepID=W8VVP2_9FLAO|nr:hemolysin III family protein [Nonlabens marinus]BAO54047.1 predicted membrane protein hemolysin III homolog [Nonlabens marinus S1-08]
MPRAQTALEERWNVITHGFGFLVFVIASYFLLTEAVESVAPYALMGIIIYCVSQLFLYAASTSYHYAKPEKIKWTLRKMDHISIYFSIAGTYTPVCLISLEQTSGWMILTAVWSIVLFGTIWKLFFTGKFEAFSSILYLVMGWMVIIDVGALQDAFSTAEMNWLIAGGISFSVGIIFYAWNRLFFNHVIWHFFVLGGSLSHLIMVWLILTT